ncbi:MAG: hypothetical protein ACR2IF_18535 [Terriglobales bacterium]
MKNIYDVLRQKESELQQLQRDIETLRAAARLLSEESEEPAVKAAVNSSARPAAVPATMKPADSYPAAGIRQFP